MEAEILTILPLLFACDFPQVVTEQQTVVSPVQRYIPDLWAGRVASDVRVTIQEAIVTSPLTAGGTTFYVQHRGGGPRSGLQVQLFDSLPGVPPPVGTPIRITGTQIQFAGGPTMWLSAQSDLEVLGPPEEPALTEFSDDPELIWALVHASDVTITSSVDPVGIASTDLGQRLRPDFDTRTPGWNRTGDLTAINGLALALLLRTDADWTGEMAGDPALLTTLGELPDLPDGTPVVVQDVVQATRWSRGGRYAVIQDASGTGFWVDTEGFGTPPSLWGDAGSWSGQLRFGGDGMRLRVWDDPEITGTGPVAIWQGDPNDAPQGAIVDDTVTELLGIGARGDRLCDDWLLDNRFELLGELTDPDDVRGAVRIDAQEIRRLAVLSH